MKKFEITYLVKNMKKAVIEDTKIVYAENELQAVNNLSMLLNDILCCKCNF